MADIPLTHLSRPQLVHLLLRIVDLLSQPVPTTSVQGGPALEPYDASLDPWNPPDPGPAASVGPCGAGSATVSGGPYPEIGQLNPGASAFYPVVSGPPVPFCHSGCPASSLGLPRFGASPKLDRPVTQVGQAGGCCGEAPQPGLPNENALPGCGPWVHVCGGLCGVCGAP